MKRIIFLATLLILSFASWGQDSKWIPSIENDKIWSLRQIESMFNKKGKIKKSVCREEIDVFIIDWYGVDSNVMVVKLNALRKFYDKKYNKKIKLVSYFSGGTYEDYRPDTASFPKTVRGKKVFHDAGQNYWVGEEWLDIRQLDVLKPIMEERVKLADNLKFDGIEWDNVDVFLYADEETEHKYCGFNISKEDQLKYNKALAEITHKYGLAVGLKNDIEQIRELHEHFDFAMNEEMYSYDRDSVQLYSKFFTEKGKPVINIEYKCNLKKCKKDCKTSIRYKILTLYKKDYFGPESKKSRCKE